MKSHSPLAIESPRIKCAQVAILVLLACLSIATRSSHAHGAAHDEPVSEATDSEHQRSSTASKANAWRTWAWEPGSLLGLALTGGLYSAGLARGWRRAGVGHGIQRWEAGCFAAGWLVLVIALISPIHPLGQSLFWVHMIQHELLMLIAAPLLVLGRPTVVFLRAIGPRAAHAVGAFSNRPAWKTVWGIIRFPLSAWALHAIILWAWHAPALFQATLHNEWIHALQHVSFLASALIFWWALLNVRSSGASCAAGVLYLFTTALHSGLLGALLTFASVSWYPDYAHTTQALGLSALEDQQIGGLVMWVPACTIYILAGLFLFARMMRTAGTSPRSTASAAPPSVATSPSAPA